MVDLHRATEASDARDEALAWFVRMNSGHSTTADKAAFEAWLGGDSRRRHEYGKLGSLWGDLDALPDPRPARSTSRCQVVRRRIVMAGAAAALAAAAAVPLGRLETILAADFRTGTGERREVGASDGTRIELDAGTAIAEEYTDDIRRLRLLEGRAMFTVTEDPRRPFEVVCDGGSIRARTGAFVVHRRVDDVITAVEAGVARVGIGFDASGQRLSVAAGQCVAYGEGWLGPVQEASTDAETSWRRGRLVFRDRPLGDVVADINRYREGRIVIADRSLAMLRLDGVFDAARPDAALDAIVSTLSLRSFRVTDYLVVLRHAAAAS